MEPHGRIGAKAGGGFGRFCLFSANLPLHYVLRFEAITKGTDSSCRIVEKYGQYLRPSLYNHIDPIATRAEALKMEETLALELRRQRYAVWFN